MTQMELIRLSKLTEDNLYDRGGEAMYDPTGDTVYGSGGEHLGTIRDALVDQSSGRVKFFIIEASSGSKVVLVPVGDARIDDQGVYFDTLTQAQLNQMTAYTEGQASAAMNMERTGTSTEDRTPDKLRLLEERLVVSKDRFKAGSVEIGKRVETRAVKAEVALQRDEVVIERRTITDAQPIEGAVLGAESKSMTIDLEAERARVSKQAYVTEEINIGKRTVTDNQTVTETVGREVLDVNKTGEVHIENPQAPADSKPKS